MKMPLGLELEFNDPDVHILQVIMATNKIESLDPALIRPGRIDRKIEFPLPDTKTKRRIFGIHTGRMTLSEDVNLEEFIMAKARSLQIAKDERAQSRQCRRNWLHCSSLCKEGTLVGPVSLFALLGNRQYSLLRDIVHQGGCLFAGAVVTCGLYVVQDEMSGADIKAACTEAGLLALRERRMRVTHADFKKAKEKVLYKKKEGVPEGLCM